MAIQYKDMMAAILVLSALWTEIKGAPKCVGGSYFDKNVGQRGRMMCCSELCEVRNVASYVQECQRKCPDYAHLKKEAEEAGQVADSGSLADAASKTVETTHVVLPILGVVLVTVLAVFYLAKKRGWRLPGLKQAADLVAGGTNDRGNAAAQQDNRNDDQLPPPQQVDEAHERLLYDGPQQQQQQQDGQQQQEQQQGQQQQQPPPQTAISARHPVEEMGGAT